MAGTYRAVFLGGNLVGSIIVAILLFWILRRFIGNHLFIAFLTTALVILFNLLTGAGITAMNVIGPLIGSLLAYFYFRDKK